MCRTLLALLAFVRSLFIAYFASNRSLPSGISSAALSACVCAGLSAEDAQCLSRRLRSTHMSCCALPCAIISLMTCVKTLVVFDQPVSLAALQTLFFLSFEFKTAYDLRIRLGVVNAPLKQVVNCEQALVRSCSATPHMSKACQGSLQDLVKCLRQSDCMKVRANCDHCNPTLHIVVAQCSVKTLDSAEGAQRCHQVCIGCAGMPEVPGSPRSLQAWPTGRPCSHSGQ